MKNWFAIENIDFVDSPALLVFEDRVMNNIETAIGMVASRNLLRPHIKTHKTIEVVKLLKKNGVNKFKCATIAEAELLGICNAKDVVLAYQPNGPKLERFKKVVIKFPNTIYSCLVDNKVSASQLSNSFSQNNISCNVFIDINVGMNRSGIKPNENAFKLYQYCTTLKGIDIKGLHVYDGHFRNADINLRTIDSDKAFNEIEVLTQKIKNANLPNPIIIAGGSPTFPIHARRKNVECSPGTFVYWDYGYSAICSEQNFLPAAVLLTRVISIIDENKICVDLGHKSVASENEITKRIHFLNADGLKPISQSEEHLVLENTENIPLKVGDVLYGLPYHVCPTVALYDSVQVVRNNHVVTQWKNIARDRTISI